MARWMQPLAPRLDGQGRRPAVAIATLLAFAGTMAGAASSQTMAQSSAQSSAQAPAQPTAQAQAEAQFFKDKTIRLLVGYGPGGGYDAYARMIAPYLSRTLAASVVVENLPGAGGIAALNRTAVAPPDGLTIQIVNGTGAALSQLLEIKTVRYDILDLTHLGTVSASPWMWMVGPGSQFKTAADAMQPGVKMSWAGSGPIDGLSDGAAFTCEALKLNCRVVIGYKGSNDAALAVIRGEMDAIYVSDTSANNVAKSGNARAIATIGRKPSRFFPDTPLIFDAVKLDTESTWILDFRAAAEDLGRILVAPPRMSPERTQFLRAAIKATLADPALAAEGEKSQRYVGYLEAAETIDNVKKVLGEPSAEQKARIKAILAKAE
jgi:tripartite-type tricarboxylate transporter receptor subunit TctC